jgi:hypothetical protein
MTDQPTEAVIAGSKGFALALLAPLTERVGTRPRIAADPSQALKLTGGTGLIVVEFQGARSLEAIRELLEQAAGVSVIAAVPHAHAGVEETLRSLGVESARWDGRPDEVLSAVSRHLAGAPAARGSPAPAPAVPATAVAPPPAAAAARVASSGVGALFDDLPLDDVSGDAAPVEAAAPHPPFPSMAPATGAWPGNVPGAAEAGDALAKALRGVFAPDGSPLAVVATVMSAMSPLERAVLLDEPLPIDVAPIRRAAVMRVRVAVALATVPQTPDPGATDPGAVSALLAEIDELLSGVNALIGSASSELQPLLEQVRNALVKEAIDFSEASHRAESLGAPQGPRPVTAVARRAAQTRVLSVDSVAEREIEAVQVHRTRRMIGLFVASALAAGAFHGYRYYERSTRRFERPTRTGVPETAAVVAHPTGTGPVVVRAAEGRPFSADELRRMSDLEALKGNVVTETAPGVVMITRAQAAPPVGAAPSPPAGPPAPAR